MSEANTPRLMAAAKEFNIGKDTLVDFLVSKGFSKDDLKPTSRLTEEMYRSLQQEFSSDKAAKAKSDAIEIPKGSAGDAKRKKDEEEILFKKESKKKVEEAPVAAPAPTPEPVVEETPAPEPVQEQAVAEPAVHTPAPAPAPEIEQPTASAEPEMVKPTMTSASATTPERAPTTICFTNAKFSRSAMTLQKLD